MPNRSADATSQEGPETIRVALAHVRGVVRFALRRLVEDSADLHLVAETANGREASEIASNRSPDVLIVGTDLPDWSGAAVARHARGQDLDMQILVVGPQMDEEAVATTVEAGVAGYLSTREDATVVAETVRALAAGERERFSRQVATALLRNRGEGGEATELGTLTGREREVLRRMADGHSNKTIAGELSVSVGAVKKNLTSIYRKLGVGRPGVSHPRVLAAARAARRGLL